MSLPAYLQAEPVQRSAADELIDRLSTISSTLRQCAAALDDASPGLPTAEERAKLRDVARKVRLDALDTLGLAARLGVR